MTGVQRTKGSILQAYTPPVPRRRVIGLDTLGPVRAKTSSGEVWTCGPGRATVAPDDGRRGRVWVLGACEPATGLATARCRPRRDSVSFMQLLEQVLETSPAREWGLSADHRSPQISRETQAALIAWPAVAMRFIPT